MRWDLEYTDEFGAWFDGLSGAEQDAVALKVQLLDAVGVALDYPHSSSVRGSRHGNLRELRIQHGGEPYRVLYAFDPQRTGVLLIGGSKVGNDRWYERMVPIADRLYHEHLAHLKREGKRR